MIKKIPHTELIVLKENHRKNILSPVITNSVTIELGHLQTFIAQAAAIPNCDAIRIHFIRYELNASQGHVSKIEGINFSQVSLALVPGNIITQAPDWIAIDLKGQDNKILTLLVCEPTGAARAIDDKTGQCPPKPPVCPEDNP
jgi:hypothetical protein